MAVVGLYDGDCVVGLYDGDRVVGLYDGDRVVGLYDGALLGADEGIANRVLDRAILSIVSQLQFTIFSHLA